MERVFDFLGRDCVNLSLFMVRWLPGRTWIAEVESWYNTRQKGIF
jgi:hypothetical protein